MVHRKLSGCYYSDTHTNWVVSHFPADYWSICIVPSIITHSAPGIVDADLHPALSWEIPIAKSYCSIIAGCIWEDSTCKERHIFKSGPVKDIHWEGGGSQVPSWRCINVVSLVFTKVKDLPQLTLTANPSSAKRLAWVCFIQVLSAVGKFAFHSRTIETSVNKTMWCRLINVFLSNSPCKNKRM